MKTNIKGIPYSTAEFDKNGKLLSDPKVPAGTTDLIVVSHGWKNDRAAAEKLYESLFGNFADVTKDDPAIKQRKIAIVGVIWPSKEFNDFAEGTKGDRTAGGAASAGAGNKKASEKAMLEAIDLAASMFDEQGDKARVKTLRKLVPDLEDDPAAQKQFVETLRELLDVSGTGAIRKSSEDGAEIFFRAPAEVVFERASKDATALPAAPQAGGGRPGDAVGHAAGIGSFFSGAAKAVTNLLNLTTYFKMKQRAGAVGEKGLGPLLDSFAPQVQQIHLAGHSFGGRVVTAAAASSKTDKLHSLALLQAAFSHNGFSKKRKGFFRSVVTDGRIHGPIFVTHTKNDKAVGVAYPIASRISGDNASAMGGPDDEFGGLGSNGAQQMEAGEVVAAVNALKPVGQPYAWQAGKFHNLESSAFIVDPDGGDAHGWVFVPQVAWALSRVMLA